MPRPDPRPIHHASATFDPQMLARSVVALPLLAEIEAEVAASRAYEEQHPDVREKYNAVVFLRERYPGGPEKAWAKVSTLVTSTAPKKPRCFIDPPRADLGGNACAGWLTADLARVLVGMDAEKPPVAIDRIWPTLHNVIIEVNLDFKARDEIVREHLVPRGQKTAGKTRSRKAAALATEEQEEELQKPETRDARAMAKRLIEVAILDAVTDLKDAAGTKPSDMLARQEVDQAKTALSSQYVFAQLSGEAIVALVAIDQERALQMAGKEAALRNSDRPKAPVKAGQKSDTLTEPVKAEELTGCFRTIYHIWPDFDIRGCMTRSISTVKADAAHRSFTALGDQITWAVMDSGVDGDHPHFRQHANIDAHSTYHADFSAPNVNAPLLDEFGHGTHVAGIIAGEQSEVAGAKKDDLRAAFRRLSVQPGKTETKTEALKAISGMAPKCRLVSLKVLDQFGQGKVSNLIAAIGHIQQINGHGRELHIHGVNISLGYPFDPKWFACGRSPLCVEVNRLVKSGVVVVVAAGNTGYGSLQTLEGKSDACLDLTINDPGNAEYAITVGSTHRDMPHVYGVSFFSSKGPTGDGRMKPDLLAPGERIVSCATGKLLANEGAADARYLETSGTSMAAPHVSGAIAAFLSIRREFIGESERVKEIFKAAATDLGRDRYFQGAGLVDLMRAIQSI